jgi:hypothetical protein
MKLSSWKNERYISILEMILRLSVAEQKAADAFYESSLHIILISKLTDALEQWSTGKSLYEDSVDKVEDQLKKFKTLASEIQALGGLLNVNHVYRGKIL